jgi:hypothetical protein
MMNNHAVLLGVVFTCEKRDSMKRFLVIIFVLILGSIACQTVTQKIPLAYKPIPINTLAVVPISTQATTLAPITCSDEICLDACLTRIDSTLQTHQFEPLGGGYGNTDAELNLVIYKVENGKLSDPTLLYVPEEFRPFQEDFQAHQLVWNYASALLPSEHLQWITEYDIFTDGTGSNGWAAWVNTRDPLDLSRWQLGVDIADAEDPIDLTYTLVHEFAHLISLNSDQISIGKDNEFYDWDQVPENCSQLSTPEGCSNPDSYINLFYQNFWLDIFDEWYTTVYEPQTDSDDEYASLVNDFYSKYQDQFAEDYAATNIEEDLAVSFETFILSSKPSGETVIDQKVLFFYNFPELVAMRKQIIQNVCSYAQE